MEIALKRFSTCLASTLLLLSATFFTETIASPPSNICRIRKVEDSVLVQEHQCTENFERIRRGVLETNGTTLEKALKILRSRESMHVAVLLYANWCPFSRALRPVVESLSSAFPSVYHFAVEETTLQPSGFSYYGIHSFPALFLHNKTGRVRYHGARTFEALSEFYKDFTGLQPLDLSESDVDVRAAESGLPAKLSGRGLNDDLYLMLSVLFLSLRIVSYLLPKILALVKSYWAYKESSRRQSQRKRGVFRWSEQDNLSNGSSRRAKGKSPMKDLTQETGKALLSVPGWPSSPLALAESSSSRAAAKEDGRDRG